MLCILTQVSDFQEMVGKQKTWINRSVVEFSYVLLLQNFVVFFTEFVCTMRTIMELNNNKLTNGAIDDAAAAPNTNQPNVDSKVT